MDGQQPLSDRQPWEAPERKYAASSTVPERERPVRLLIGVSVLTVVVFAWRLIEYNSANQSIQDFSDRVTDVAPLLELHQLDGGWVGVVDPDWDGIIDNTVAVQACERLAARMNVEPSSTVALFNITGTPIVECEG